MQKLGPLLKHKTVGLIFEGTQPADSVLDETTRIWNFQHSPFISHKIIWELKRVTYTINTSRPTGVSVPAGAASGYQYALFLYEDPLDTPLGIPFQRPVGTTPLPIDSTFDLEHAFENNTRILDSYGYSQTSFIDTNVGASGAGAAWVEPNIHTNILPVGCIVVPEYVSLYARITVGDFPFGDSVLSVWVTLDYIEHFITTVEKLQLAGITSSLVITRV